MPQAIEARQHETRILVVDDSEPMRRNLRTLLEGRDHWKVCDEASNGQEAVMKFSNEKFDVVVGDCGGRCQTAIEQSLSPRFAQGLVVARRGIVAVSGGPIADGIAGRGALPRKSYR
jgi:DNA-binding NarL/FixJ family response regulator